jgi:hypothetical protein
LGYPVFLSLLARPTPFWLARVSDFHVRAFLAWVLSISPLTCCCCSCYTVVDLPGTSHFGLTRPRARKSPCMGVLITTRLAARVLSSTGHGRAGCAFPSGTAVAACSARRTAKVRACTRVRLWRAKAKQGKRCLSSVCHHRTVAKHRA